MGKALDHKKRTLALKQSTAASETDKTATVMSEYNRMLVEIAAYERELKSIKSHVERNKQKAEILPEFIPYVEGVLASESGVQDDVLMRVYMWLCDVGDFERAIDIAEYAIAYGLTLPGDMKRDAATLLLDEISAAKPDDQEQYLSWLKRVQTLTDGLDIHDEVSAKFYKALGLAFEGEGQLESALSSFNTAIEFNENIGLKNAVKSLAKQISKQDQKQPNS